jgi:flagellar hook assembly protein FlgD
MSNGHATLYQSILNPHNHTTAIAFDLSERSSVCLCIYNAEGQLVRRLLGRSLDAGKYTAYWDGLDEHMEPVNNGVYECCLRTDRNVSTGKLVMLSHVGKRFDIAQDSPGV